MPGSSGLGAERGDVRAGPERRGRDVRGTGDDRGLQVGAGALPAEQGQLPAGRTGAGGDVVPAAGLERTRPAQETGTAVRVPVAQRQVPVTVEPEAERALAVLAQPRQDALPPAQGRQRRVHPRHQRALARSRGTDLVTGPVRPRDRLVHRALVRAVHVAGHAYVAERRAVVRPRPAAGNPDDLGFVAGHVRADHELEPFASANTPPARVSEQWYPRDLGDTRCRRHFVKYQLSGKTDRVVLAGIGPARFFLTAITSKSEFGCQIMGSCSVLNSSQAL